MTCLVTMFDLKVFKTSPNWPFLAFLMKCKHSSLRSQYKMRLFCDFQTLCKERDHHRKIWYAKSMKKMSRICHSWRKERKGREKRNLAFFICLLFDQCTFFLSEELTSSLRTEGNDITVESGDPVFSDFYWKVSPSFGNYMTVSHF